MKKGDVKETPIPGRPRIGPELSESIIQIYDQHTHFSVRQILGILNSNGEVASFATVLNRMHELGFKPETKSHKTPLTLVQAQDRLDWCQNHLAQDWGPVVFTDETTFETSARVLPIWTRKSNVVSLTSSRDPNIREKINAWGCFTSRGFGHLFLFNDNLTADLMTIIYSDALLPTAQQYFGEHGHWILQEDNDPKHTAHLSRTFKDDHDIQVLDWPSNSADLNPIENVWSVMKNKMRGYDTSTLSLLQFAISSIWENLAEEMILNLFSSMQTRLQQCIDLDGRRTRY